MSNLELISDYSKEKLVAMPKDVLDMVHLKMLFLEGNFLTKLPDDLFWKLPKLMWLDVRNNLLETIPKSIAYHEGLENLLLSNNNLKTLPNELGTVPNLKTLQVLDNPLIYPDKKIISGGIKVIQDFLKTQYDKITKNDTESEENTYEKIGIQETSNDTSTTEQIKIDRLKTKICDEMCINPDLDIKKVNTKKDDRNIKIVHHITNPGNKICIKSSYNTPRLNPEVKFGNLKEGWLNELKTLLSDQERILQQERNLRALSNWRLRRKYEPIRDFIGDTIQPPYDTDPQYNKMLTREELARTLNEYKQKGYVSTSGDSHKTTSIELQRMIKDIMEQLKEVELNNSTNNVDDMINAEKQIRTMMEIQKKLMSLKSLNDVTV